MLEVLQKHDGLAIHDPPVINHRQCFGKRQLQYLDVFAFLGQTTAIADAILRLILTDKKMQAFSHRAGAHERFVDLTHRLHAIAGFFFGLKAHALFRAGVIQQTGSGFDQVAVMAIDERRDAELADENDGALSQIIETDRGAIAAIVDLAGERLPAAVTALQFEIDLLQDVPVVREQMLGDDAHIAVIHEQAALLEIYELIPHVCTNFANRQTHIAQPR